jgi:hypothetical protein
MAVRHGLGEIMHRRRNDLQACHFLFCRRDFVACAFVVFDSPPTELPYPVERETLNPTLRHLTNSKRYALGDPMRQLDILSGGVV